MRKPIGYVTHTHSGEGGAVTYWEVTDRHRRDLWWSVAKRVLQGTNVGTVWTVTNSRGRILEPPSPTRDRVMAAVHDYEKNTERDPVGNV